MGRKKSRKSEAWEERKKKSRRRRKQEALERGKLGKLEANVERAKEGQMG